MRARLPLLLIPSLWLPFLACGDKGTASNAPPSAPEVSISPAEPHDADDLVATVDTPSVDPDGDEVSYTYTWYKDEVKQEGVRTDTVPDNKTAKGDSWRVVVTPDDGHTTGDAAEASVTVVNGDPTLSVSLSPASVDTNGTLTAVSTSSDPDGDTLSLSWLWRVSGRVVAEDSDRLDGTLFFQKGDEVQVEVTADDGDGGVVTATSEVLVVGNLPPTAPTVSISPASPTSADELLCAVDGAATDPDADSLRYTVSWTVDGTAFPGAVDSTWSGDTVPATATTAGQVWACTAVADDGTDTGPASAEASVTITDWAGPRELTSCGAEGRLGPTQAACDAAYRGTSLEGEVSVGAGIQQWVVPETGTYQISAYGAQGASATTTMDGGLGAYASGRFDLHAGDVLQIAVGQVGLGGGSGSNGGGGGGSFVVDAAGTPLLVAGGGGGTRTEALSDGCPGQGTQYATEGSGSNDTWRCPAKTTDLGMGGVISSESWGSAGAGFYGDGEGEYLLTGASCGYGGASWANGLLGGTSEPGCGFEAHGGFGGGGSGNGYYGGGGGGGYSGGDGGWIAGGAGSTVAGSAAVITTGLGAGDGSVTIDLAD